MGRAKRYHGDRKARPRDLRRYRRDQGKFKFWRTKAGNWRGQLADNTAPTFAWKAPKGRFLGKDGNWYKLVKGRIVPVTAPAMFSKRKRTTKLNDEAGLKEFQKLLNAFTPTIWSYEKTAPIKPRLSKDTTTYKSIQGFRTVAMYVSSSPYITTWFDLQLVVREAGENPKLAKVFGSRRTAIHIEYFDVQHVLHWTTPTLARDWNTSIAQASPQFAEWAGKYVVRDDDDDDNPESAIRRIQLMIE